MKCGVLKSTDDRFLGSLNQVLEWNYVPANHAIEMAGVADAVGAFPEADDCDLAPQSRTQ